MHPDGLTNRLDSGRMIESGEDLADSADDIGAPVDAA